MTENVTWEVGNSFQILLRDILLEERCISKIEQEIINNESFTLEESLKIATTILDHEITRTKLHFKLAQIRHDSQRQTLTLGRLGIMGEIKTQLSLNNRKPISLFLQSRSADTISRAAKHQQTHRREELINLSEKYLQLAKIIS